MFVIRLLAIKNINSRREEKKTRLIAIETSKKIATLQIRYLYLYLFGQYI